jgi:hypothetical protein
MLPSDINNVILLAAGGENDTDSGGRRRLGEIDKFKRRLTIAERLTRPQSVH